MEFDTPNLTAYALGELSRDEAALVEAQLAANPAARALVDQIRATARQVQLELSQEPQMELSPQQLSDIEDRLEHAAISASMPQTPPASPRPRPARWRTLATAACFALAGAGAFWAIQELTKADRPQEQVSGVDAPKSPEDPRTQQQRVLAKLEQRVPEFTANTLPIHEVFSQISELAGVDFFVDWTALEAAGIRREKAIYLHARQVRLSRLLQMALNQNTPLAYHVVDGVIEISTADALRQPQEVLVGPAVVAVYNITDLVASAQLTNVGNALHDPKSNVYSVRDLLIVPPDVEVPPDFALSGGSGLFGANTSQLRSSRLADGGAVYTPRPDYEAFADGVKNSAPAGQFMLAPGPTAQTSPQENLVDLIQQVVNPHEWVNHGGTMAHIHLLSGQLVISAPRQMHDKIEDLLNQIRSNRSDAGDALSQMHVPEPTHSTESYARIYDNPFLDSIGNPLSTFSIDVDTASYSNIRRFLTGGQVPPPDAVRIEEMINYFPYTYEPPKDDLPFATHIEVASCPWQPKHRLVRIGLKGHEIVQEQRPAGNFVFLIDVSGSMLDENKLPMVRDSMKMLVSRLNERDRVAIVVYASAQGLVLDSTPCTDKNKIIEALDKLSAGGSTNGGAGIQLAYKLASENFIEGGVNRVILATDGDFNVGITSEGDLTRLIEEKAKSGVFLSVLGFGMGNVKDSTMEKLANKGNGNYAYIDTLNEARKVLIEQMAGTLVTIAKDVKIQVEFNPGKVAAYRLIGYENRLLAKEDFNDDTKDAGEIGAGHTVTAFYEIVPAGTDIDTGDVDELKYQKVKPADPAAVLIPSDELLTVKLRYKAPDGQKSTKIEFPAKDPGGSYRDASTDFRFAAAVASFGMLLRESPHKGIATHEMVLDLAQASIGEDAARYRVEFLELVNKARELVEK